MNKAEKTNKYLEISLFFLILLLAAYFRFVSLRANPGWYSDEGVFIDFSANLSEGRWQALGSINAPMLIQRPPLFLFVLAGAFRLFGSDILVLRCLTASYGLLCVALLFLLGRRILNNQLALLAAFFMAVHPTIVAYNRIGLTYNQLMALVLLTLYTCWLYMENRQARWAWAMCIAAALAFSTDFLGLVAPVIVAGVLLAVDRRRFVPGMLLMAFIVILILSPFYFVSPMNFELGLRSIFSSRVSTSGISPMIGALLNYGELLRRESWIAIGLAGLFLLPERRIRALAILTASLGILLVVRNQAPVGRGLHYLMGIFPLLALGLAAFVYRALPLATGVFQDLAAWAADRFPKILNREPFQRAWPALSKILVAGIIFGLVVSPLVWMVLADAAQSLSGYYFIFTGNDELNLTPEKDAVQVVDYLSQHADQGDLVLASPQIAWAVPGFGVDYAGIIFYENKLGDPFIKRSMFVRPVTLQDTSYAILDPLAREFAPLVLPGMDELILEIERWPLAFQAGEIEVYRNPKAPTP